MKKEQTPEGSTQVVKTDNDRHLVFGWASVAVRKDGSAVVDGEGDMIVPQDLEDAAYVFVLKFRDLNERHRGSSKGQLVESLVVTPEKLEKMGLAPDALPVGWWVGFYVEDDEAWEKVKAGEYRMFSIEGSAEREAL